MATDHIPYDGAVVTQADARAAGLTRFYTGKPCKHGHLSQRTTCNGACIACNRKTNLEAYRAECPEKKERRRQSANAWCARNREVCRAKGRENSKRIGNRYKAANRERMNELGREARKRNPDAVKARVRRYLETDKGKRQAIVATTKRRALKLNAEGEHTAADVVRIGEAQGWKCHWCKKPTKKKYEVDHLVPLSKGGTNWPNNLAVTCQPCNRMKHALDPIAFAQRMGLLL